MKFLQSVMYALRGMAAAMVGRDFRIQFVCGVLAIAFGLFFKISAGEWLALLICVGGVLSAEMMNTAIEKIADFIHPQKNDRIGQLKDIAAGAVLVWALASLVIALIIFLPKILAFA